MGNHAGRPNIPVHCLSASSDECGCATREVTPLFPAPRFAAWAVPQGSPDTTLHARVPIDAQAEVATRLATTNIVLSELPLFSMRRSSKPVSDKQIMSGARMWAANAFVGCSRELLFRAITFVLIVASQAKSIDAPGGELLLLLNVPPPVTELRPPRCVFEPTNFRSSPAHERAVNRFLRAGSGAQRGGRTLAQASCGVPQSLFSIPPGTVNVSFFSVLGGGYSATVRLRAAPREAAISLLRTADRRASALSRSSGTIACCVFGGSRRSLKPSPSESP